MERRNVLKAIGALGIGSMLPAGKIIAGAKSPQGTALHNGVDCVLIPQETEGPYVLNLSSNQSVFRQDITEGRPGISLDLVFTVVNINDNCSPVANARVDLWHCDKDGVYSGFSQPGGNTVGQTFMRGIQMTDANGQVRFHTVYPGWYNGRVTHMHFQVFTNSVLKATSQIAFPDSLTTAVYNTPLYSGRGQNTSVPNNTADMVFASPPGSLQYELLNVTENSATGGYDGTFTIGINAPVAGLTLLEPETGGQFVLRQNSPNPFRNSTAVGFSLVQTSNVEAIIYDMSGSEIVKLFNGRLGDGEHNLEWDRRAGERMVPAGNYLLQLTVENGSGTFRQCKVMTVK